MEIVAGLLWNRRNTSRAQGKSINFIQMIDVTWAIERVFALKVIIQMCIDARMFNANILDMCSNVLRSS